MYDVAVICRPSPALNLRSCKLYLEVTLTDEWWGVIRKHPFSVGKIVSCSTIPSWKCLQEMHVGSLWALQHFEGVFLLEEILDLGKVYWFWRIIVCSLETLPSPHSREIWCIAWRDWIGYKGFHQYVAFIQLCLHSTKSMTSRSCKQLSLFVMAGWAWCLKGPRIFLSLPQYCSRRIIKALIN